MKIVITGSSTGIGRAIAKELLAKKHQVWGVARRNQSDLKKLYPLYFHPIQADVSDWHQMQELADALKIESESLDALITCAGFQGEIAPLEETNPEKWSNTVRGNINGTFFPMRALYHLLAKSEQQAKIICFSGGGSTKARPRFSAYGAAKTAIVRLVETAALEWEDRRIDVNAIAPGRINTSMMDEIIARGASFVGEEEYSAALKQKTDKEDSLDSVLALVVWLLSTKSDGVSGKLISAQWDQWDQWQEHIDKLKGTNLYTLRRMTARERGYTWGDKE